MVELVVALALVFGLVRAVRSAHWSVACLGLLSAYLCAADLLAALPNSREPVSALQAFVVFLLGPGGMLERHAAWLPLPELMLEHPLLLRCTVALLAFGALWLCQRENERLNPLMPRARTLDAISAPFVLFAVLQAMLAVQMLLVGHLVRGA